MFTFPKLWGDADDILSHLSCSNIAIILDALSALYTFLLCPIYYKPQGHLGHFLKAYMPKVNKFMV